MKKTVTKEAILKELRHMVSLCKANRRYAQPISIDTLAITFRVPIQEVIDILLVLEKEGLVSLQLPPATTAPNTRGSKRIAGTITLVE